MKFVISYGKTIQVTEDSWRESLRTMIADEKTTLGQIKEWFLRDNNPSNPLKQCKMDDVKISEPEY